MGAQTLRENFRRAQSMGDEKISLSLRDLQLFYGTDRALNGIDLDIPEKRVTAFIGPSGCGKSTLLR